MHRTMYRIQNLPEDDRPRERLMRQGPESMATSELVAVILGSGTKGVSVLQIAQEIVARFGTLEKLAEATIEEFCQIKGLGKAKAIQLKAALSLGVRVARGSNEPKYKIQNPWHAYHLVKDILENEKKEIFMVILQDVKGHVLHTLKVAVGSLSSSVVHPREVFHPAVRHHAASLVLAHNHPSGDPTPSREDLETTRHLIEAGKMMGIPVNDHLVIGKNAFVSMRQEGLVSFFSTAIIGT